MVPCMVNPPPTPHPPHKARQFSGQATKSTISKARQPISCSQREKYTRAALKPLQPRPRMRCPKKQPPAHPQICIITTPHDSRPRSPPPPQHTPTTTLTGAQRSMRQFLGFSPFQFCSPGR